MAKHDYHEVPGIDKNVSEDEIKKAYRKLAIKYHPDRNPNSKETEGKFKEATGAYDVLHNPQKRQQYGQFGFNAPGIGGFGEFGETGGFSMDDIFSMFGNISDGHGDLNGFSGFGGEGSKQRPQYRDSDLRLKVKLSLQEIAIGVTKKSKVGRDVTCTHYHSSGAENGSQSETYLTCRRSGVVVKMIRTMLGMMQTQTECPSYHGEDTVIKDKYCQCHGIGVVKGKEVVEIKVPAGAAEGMVVNIPGKGDAGQQSDISRNIQVYVKEEEDDTFIRDGQDIVYNLLLDFPTAALGGEVEIPTLEGTCVRIKINADTQPGKTSRLRGEGLPAAQGYGSRKGDLVVYINVFVPKTLSRGERSMLENLRNNDSFKNGNVTKRSIFKKFRNYFD